MEPTVNSQTGGVSTTPRNETPEDKTRKFFESLAEQIKSHPIGNEVFMDAFSPLCDDDSRIDLFKKAIDEADVTIDEAMDVIIEIFGIDSVLEDINENHTSLLDHVIENHKRDIEDYVNSDGSFSVKL